MWQLWEFMGIVARRAAEERLAWWEGSQRGAGQPEPARYRNDLMHNSHPSLQTVPQHECLRIKGCWFRLRNPFHECKLLICVYYTQRLMDFWHTVLVKLKGANFFFLLKIIKKWSTHLFALFRMSLMWSVFHLKVNCKLYWTKRQTGCAHFMPGNRLVSYAVLFFSVSLNTRRIAPFFLQEQSESVLNKRECGEDYRA